MKKWTTIHIVPIIGIGYYKETVNASVWKFHVHTFIIGCFKISYHVQFS